MKKIISLLLILAMCMSVCLFVASCNDNGDETPGTSDNPETPDDGDPDGGDPDNGEPDGGEESGDGDTEDGPPTGNWLPID